MPSPINIICINNTQLIVQDLLNPTISEIQAYIETNGVQENTILKYYTSTIGSCDNPYRSYYFDKSFTPGSNEDGDDFEILTPGKGVILSSPDSSQRKKIFLNNSGELITITLE